MPNREIVQENRKEGRSVSRPPQSDPLLRPYYKYSQRTCTFQGKGGILQKEHMFYLYSKYSDKEKTEMLPETKNTKIYDEGLSNARC